MGGTSLSLLIVSSEVDNVERTRGVLLVLAKGKIPQIPQKVAPPPMHSLRVGIPVQAPGTRAFLLHPLLPVAGEKVLAVAMLDIPLGGTFLCRGEDEMGLVDGLLIIVSWECGQVFLVCSWRREWSRLVEGGNFNRGIRVSRWGQLCRILTRRWTHNTLVGRRDFEFCGLVGILIVFRAW